MWNNKKFYEILKLEIEALNARTENNEFQIRKILEMLDELKNKNQSMPVPKDIKAYGFSADGKVYEIDQDGQLTNAPLPKIDNEGEQK